MSAKEVIVPSAWVRDVVPHLPPRDVGPFKHVGRHYHTVRRTQGDAGAAEFEWSELPASEIPQQADSILALALAFAGYLAKQIDGLGAMLEGAETAADFTRAPQRLLARLPYLGFLKVPVQGRYSLYEHIPSHYIACSQPPGVLTEFGDDF